MEWFIGDIVWLALMWRVIRFRRNLSFQKRQWFDDALRPEVPTRDVRVLYPEAIYHIDATDFERAKSVIPR